MSTSALREWLSARHARSLRRAAALSPDAHVLSPRKRLARVLGLWLVAILIAGFFDASDNWGFGWGFGWFEGYAYNRASALRARLDTRDAVSLGDAGWSKATDVVIVSLSDETFSPSNFSRLPGPPVPRDYHARLVRFLSEAGARVVAFDLIFDAEREEDEEFAQSVRGAEESGTKVLWATLTDESNQLLLPNEQLRKASDDVAHILVERNPTRPLIERIAAFLVRDSDVEDALQTIPALSLKIALLARGIESQTPRRTGSGWQIGEFLVPTASDGTFAISYTSTPEGAFPYVPYETLLDPGEETTFFQQMFEDKIVLVGDTTKLGNDWKDTPLGVIPGVEIHAHAVNTLLHERFLRAAPEWLNLLLVALLPAALLTFHNARRLSTLVAVMALLFFGYLLLALWIFVVHAYSVHFIGPLFGLALFATGLLIERGLREERERRRMFEALVIAASSAIESRDPATAGHSRRVTCLTVELAIAVSAAWKGKYRRVKFTRTQIKELCYSALMHDFGKIGVREAVLTKSHKLEPQHFEAVKSRLLLLRSSRVAEYSRCKLKLMLDAQTEQERSAALQELEVLEERERTELEALNRDVDLLQKANDPQVTFLPDAEYSALGELLDRLESQTYPDQTGERLPLITPEERAALEIRKGSLTDGEFKQIQSHAQMSYDFLNQIPWTRDLENLAKIAWGHHEKLNGKGYPRGIAAEEIPLKTRMMTIADIYDALTAADRPYKKAMPVEKALNILQMEAKDNCLDSDLLEIFLSLRIYEAVTDGRVGSLLQAMEKSNAYSPANPVPDMIKN